METPVPKTINEKETFLNVIADINYSLLKEVISKLNEIKEIEANKSQQKSFLVSAYYKIDSAKSYTLGKCVGDEYIFNNVADNINETLEIISVNLISSNSTPITNFKGNILLFSKSKKLSDGVSLNLDTIDFLESKDFIGAIEINQTPRTISNKKFYEKELKIPCRTTDNNLYAILVTDVNYTSINSEEIVINLGIRIN